MAEEVTTGDWERDYKEKHLSFLLKRQRRSSLSESALHTGLVSVSAPFTELHGFPYYFLKREGMVIIIYRAWAAKFNPIFR